MHTLLQCISPKCGAWDQFSSFLAHGIICLSKGRKYNWSKYVFIEMVGNIRDTRKIFLMYPRFLQIILDVQINDLSLKAIGRHSAKLFATMKTGYAGEHFPLLPAMLPGGNEEEEEAIKVNEGNVAGGNIAASDVPSSSSNSPGPTIVVPTDASASAAT